MKFILFLLSFFFISSCELPHGGDDLNLFDKQSLAIEVRNKAFAQLKMEKGLHPFGMGSRMMDQIKMLALAFHYYKEVNIDEARDLLMTAGTVFLDIINSTEKIHPYLENYPFQPQNIDIVIYLKNPNGLEVASNKLCVISLINGILAYKVDQPDRFLTIHEETFDEAASKLNTAVGF